MDPNPQLLPPNWSPVCNQRQAPLEPVRSSSDLPLPLPPLTATTTWTMLTLQTLILQSLSPPTPPQSSAPSLRASVCRPHQLLPLHHNPAPPDLGPCPAPPMPPLTCQPPLPGQEGPLCVLLQAPPTMQCQVICNSSCHHCCPPPAPSPQEEEGHCCCSGRTCPDGQVFPNCTHCCYCSCPTGCVRCCFCCPL
jgi:hypothetical protein